MTSPTLLAVPAACGCCALVWCAHCGREHRHGAQSGHRAAHCRDSDSPYRRSGYVLQLTPDPRHRGSSSMTAAKPVRHAGRSWTASADDDQLAQAENDVATARAVVQAVRRRITREEDGAASLSTAEYRLAAALDKLAALGGTPPPSFLSPDPDDELEGAA